MEQQKQISEVIQQLQKALLESLEATKAEDEAKQRKIRAHNNLLLAKQELYALTNELLCQTTSL